MRVREYSGPLGVIAAGIVGFSLLCTMSALAMGDLNNYEIARVESVNIMDLAVENLSTSVALTEQEVTAFVATPTIAPTDTDTLKFTATPLPSQTFAVSASATPPKPTSTRRFQVVDTARPIPSRTPRPPDTKTPVPPTNTPQPPPDTEPPPTDTSAPPPADTEPPPTDPPTQESTEPPVTSAPIEVLDATQAVLP